MPICLEYWIFLREADDIDSEHKLQQHSSDNDDTTANFGR